MRAQYCRSSTNENAGMDISPIPAWSQPGRYEVENEADDEADGAQTDERDVPDDRVLGVIADVLDTL